MKIKSIITILLITILSISLISLYTTFAYNEEAAKLSESNADYDLIYLLKEKNNKTVSVNAKEEKYIDIKFTNTYSATVKYGMYYSLVKPNKLPENVIITLSEDSQDKLEDTIKGFKEIIEGKHDNLPEQAFYMVGTIEEAVEKAKGL